MKAPLFLKQLFNQLDNSFKIVLLVIFTVSLTGLALVLSSQFVQQVQHNELTEAAQLYTQELRIQLQTHEEHLQQFADNEANNTFVSFGQAAKRLIEKNPSFLRLELRTDSGLLVAQRESSNDSEMWAPNSRQQLPPAVLLNFLRAIEQQKIYWAHSHAPSGDSAAELIVPSRTTKYTWVIRIDTNYWEPERSGITLAPHIQVSLNEHAPENLDTKNSVATPLGLPGTHTHLVFTYTQTPAWQLNGVSLMLAVMGVCLCLLLISYALDTRRYKSAREIIAKQESALAFQNQLTTMAEISTTLAHELNQPLATIANYVATCEMYARSDTHTDPKLLEMLQQARQEALRAGEVVQSIRNYLKRGTRVTNTVELATLIKSLMPVVELVAKEHSAKVRTDLKSGVWVQIDTPLLEQVVMNLCRNGLDAMVQNKPHDRLLLISVDKHCASRGVEWARITITDQGHGITSEVGEKLFDSFYSTKPHGMGVGLNLCRSVAESYGGRIRWHNNPHRGASFTLLLPIVKA